MLRSADSVIFRYGSLGPWGPTLGLARSIVAIGSLLTLVFTPTTSLIVKADQLERVCSGAVRISAYCTFSPGNYWIATLICVIILAWVASGFLPALSCIPHAWVAFSLSNTIATVDGGDQVAQNLALLFIPVFLFYPTLWHWNTDLLPSGLRVRRLIAWSSIFVIGFQAVILYAQSWIAKLAVPEWTNGTALYYWMNEATFGPPDIRGALTSAVLENPVLSGLATFSVLAVEAALSVSFLLRRNAKHKMLVLGLVFHLGIAVFLGLISFMFSMWALLIVYLGDLRDGGALRESLGRLRTKSAKLRLRQIRTQ